MKKYWQIFQIGVSEVFVWRVNFILWRVRVVLRLLLLYFLWSTVFAQQQVVFGYDRAQILTYILGVALLSSLIISSKTQEVAAEIRDGYLTNFLVRPLPYFNWWWTRDFADKAVNLVFAIAELTLLYLILKPTLFLQSDVLALGLTLVAVILALVLWFYFSFIISLFAFWMSEVWGIRFLLFIALEFLSGGTFPLDILPSSIFNALSLTPFPYLLYFPIKIYLGQLPLEQIVFGFTILVAWIFISILGTNFLWTKGLVAYGGEGR